MDNFEFVIALVVICVGADLMHKWIKKKADLGANHKQQEFEQLIAAVESLEQRMRVVEEIVSSKSFNLRQQFDELKGG